MRSEGRVLSEELGKWAVNCWQLAENEEYTDRSLTAFRDDGGEEMGLG